MAGKRRKAGRREAKRGAQAAEGEPGKSQPERGPAAAAAQSGRTPPTTPASAFGLSRANCALIALFLVYQVAMPLRYYLGGRGDDERFSWRMFSSVRLQRCKVHVREVEAGKSREVDLSKAVQVAWIGMLERDRPQVVHRLLARRCQEPAVEETRYERSCTDTDGSALPTLEQKLDCKSGRLETLRGKP